MVKPDRLAERVRALGEAVAAADARATADVLERARTVVEHAGQRAAFSGSRTVVALAGATGSGKSSLFNALTGTELAEVAVRRPTTGRAMAASWGTEAPHELLDWLDVTHRHLLPSAPNELSDLVLLDLPDHDSTEVHHRLAVDNLVELVDALIWVVDPQKYADAALHEGYLRPLAPYAPVMLVVLNQADLLAADDLARCLADLRRLLDAEGLRATPIMATSALRGTGIDELRQVLARTVAGKQAMARRLATDVSVAAKALQVDLGGAQPRLDAGAEQRVVRLLADAAGANVVVEGVRRAWLHRGALATGWPLVNWLGRFRPDPLKRLRLDLRPGEHSPAEVNRTSLPKAAGVPLARADQALRELVDGVSADLPRGWARVVGSVATDNRTLLLERLDAAIAGADLGVPRRAWWWLVFSILQWLLIAAVVAGAGWGLVNPLLLGFGLPQLPVPDWYQVPAPLWLVAGGLLGGILLAVVGRLLVSVGARSCARVARRSLGRAVGAVVATEVLEPVRAELSRYRLAREAVARALR